MARPRLLDLFCGAGGAGMGYHRAGFEVVGVDHKPQPHYPFEFHEADAMTFPLDGFDVVHASPPCQRYANVTKWRGDPNRHPAFIACTREHLKRLAVPYVIENVIGAPLLDPTMLCGTMFGLPIIRHRLFESSVPLAEPPACNHTGGERPFMHKQERAYADAMGCEWMTNREGREAIPPAYTEWIGKQLLRHLQEQWGEQGDDDG